MTKLNVPQLRFKEFSGEWEEKALNTISMINPKSNTLPDLFVYIDLESVDKGILTKETKCLLKDAPSRAQRLLECGDIIFQMVRPYQRNNLFFDKKESNYVASTGYAQLRSNENPQFLYQSLHTESFVDEVINRCTGTSYPAINTSSLETIKISLPSLPEQTKIASFLSSVDSKLTLLITKKDALIQYKKGVMQQIFNQEIRFKDEDGNDYPDWQTKLAKEIFINHSNKNHDGTLPILAATQTNGIVPRDSIGIDIKSSEQSILSYKIIEAGDFIISLRSFQGGIELSNIKGICSPAYTVLRAKINICAKFYKSYFKREEFISQLSATVMGIRDGKQISFDAFSSMKLLFPSLSEQTKIASFLTSLDDKINVMDQQIEKVKKWKKGLLQGMFV